MNRETLLTLLQAHQPWDDTETQHRDATLAFLDRRAQFWQRSTVEGHITASAWVVDRELQHALLVHHRKLDRWFQPGGHIDDDADIATAAQREAQEECGVQTTLADDGVIFDVDVHPIPGNSKELGHLHYDVRLLLIADRTAPLVVSAESKDVRWMPIAELLSPDTDASIRRMALKTEARRNASAVV